MAKIKISFSIVLVFLVCISAFSQSDLRDKLQQSYTSQIGIREASGQNDGFDVEKYLASTGLGKGYAWCAAFVNWNFKQIGVQTVKSPAWSPSWFPEDKIIYQPSTHTLNAFPQSGDVFGIYFNSKGRIAHVGFVDQWPGGQFAITVEGNTNDAGSREGDGVYRKKRIKRQIHSVSSFI